MHRYLDTPQAPFRDALTQICGRKAPTYVRGYSCQDMTESEYEKLQHWVNNAGLPEHISWSTGIGIIEAAEYLVEEAVSNGNIPTAPWSLHRAARAVLFGYHRRIKKAFDTPHTPRSHIISLDQIYCTLKADTLARPIPPEPVCLRLSKNRLSEDHKKAFPATLGLLKTYLLTL